VKSGVVRGAECELFIVGAEVNGKPQLFLVESGTEGITIESDPAAQIDALVTRYTGRAAERLAARGER